MDVGDADFQQGLDVVSSPNHSRWNRLTTREKEVAHLLAIDLSNREIAHRLDISPKTVAAHLSQLMIKLCIDNRGALLQCVSAILKK